MKKRPCRTRNRTHARLYREALREAYSSLLEIDDKDELVPPTSAALRSRADSLLREKLGQLRLPPGVEAPE